MIFFFLNPCNDITLIRIINLNFIQKLLGCRMVDITLQSTVVIQCIRVWDIVVGKIDFTGIEL